MLNNFCQRIITGTIFLLIFFGTFIFFPKIFFILIQFIIPLEILNELRKLFRIKTVQGYISAILYALIPFTLIGAMYKNIIFRPLVALLFATTFTFDSACYVSGKIFGKTKICPKISPGKTWQGFFGGYIILIILFSTILYFYKNQFNFLFIVPFAFVCAFFAFVGDIFESWLKRKARVKDSGSILPGHGGLLDRFDSVIFLAIVFYIFKNQIVKLFF